VRTTQRAAEERLAAAAAAEAGVAQAEENLRIRRQQFDAGRATSDDVLDAEALLAAQRATRAGALYQAHTRRAELQELLGSRSTTSSPTRGDHARRLALAGLVLPWCGGVVAVRRDRTPPHYTGFVEARSASSAASDGRVLEVPFAEGVQVPANAVLARLDNADIQTRLVAKHEELDVAEADIRRQQQQSSSARAPGSKTWARGSGAPAGGIGAGPRRAQLEARGALVATGASTGQLLDDARARRDQARSALDRARDLLRRAEAEEGRSPSPAASSRCSSSAVS